MDSGEPSRCWLVYAPSKDSAYGHATRPRALPKLVPRLLAFFHDFALSAGPKDIRLDLWSPIQSDAGNHFEMYYEKAKEFLGAPPKPGDFFLKTAGQSAQRLNRTSTIEPHDFQRALDFMVQGSPWPKQKLGPVSLQFSYDFMWRDPRTGQPFPEQEQGYNTQDGKLNCSFLLSLEQNSFIQPELTLPFNLADPRLYDMLGVVAPALPFKLSIKNFRLRVPLATRNGHKLSRIPESDLARLAEFVR